MKIYFAGPKKYAYAALKASQYCITGVARRLQEADALILIWDGKDIQVEALLHSCINKPRYVHRIPYN